MFFDHLVHQWLSESRFIPLVVAPAPVRHEVDDNVLLERHTVVKRDLRDEQYCQRVVTVYVKNRRLHQLSHLSAVVRGAGIRTFADRVADLIIDDHVDGTTSVEADAPNATARFANGRELDNIASRTIRGRRIFVTAVLAFSRSAKVAVRNT